MNIVIHARTRASTLAIGSVLLVVPEEDPTAEVGPERLPVPYTVKELRTTLEGLEVYAMPQHRDTGKRVVWRFDPSAWVDIELDSHVAADVLEAMHKVAAAEGVQLLRGPGGPRIPLPIEEGAPDE